MLVFSGGAQASQVLVAQIAVDVCDTYHTAEGSWQLTSVFLRDYTPRSLGQWVCTFTALPRHSSITGFLICPWSCTSPMFQTWGTRQMPLMVLSGYQSPGDHFSSVVALVVTMQAHSYTATESIGMNHSCDSSYTALLGWNHRKKMTGSLLPTEQTNGSVSRQQILLPLPHWKYQPGLI